MTKTAAIILAAGKGTRMHSPHAKAWHAVAQRPMIKWVESACRAAGIDKIIAVVGHRQDELRAVLGDSVLYAEQKELLGTGHAVMQAMPAAAEVDTVIILSGDVPLIQGETIQKALQFHKAEGNAVTVMTAALENPTGYGRIVRDMDGQLLCITEQKDADAKTLQIKEVNSGMYCFRREALEQALQAVRADNAQGEYYLTDTIAILRAAGERTGAYCMEDAAEMGGVNDMLQLYEVDCIMRKRIAMRHMANGVHIWNMENTYIAPEVEIAAGAEIRPGCILNGNTKIAENAIVGPNTTLENCTVGMGTDIVETVAKDAVIGKNVHVGPFAYIRPGSQIGDNCKVGDFVEIKNATLGDCTKVSHLTYVGDADVGQKVNFGCGTVTVNYDGKIKHRTSIGNNAFIGCNTNLVAPVSVGDGAYIAAGSTITDAVPEETLAIARARQVIKENWTDKRNR
ncbi:MAG: bifunctional UDP-N-acetylglucosamine diphosphorylase/glucosamine-1-phosphate N-acetyltransferase GlmU [Clostridia bacterium]|nr:bifunctional UDP-N-acetylglucosamine diphosphorylase/glucosamine-1-phosphate N-acetyltransferase GlmU [Clostridia bacterium]